MYSESHHHGYRDYMLGREARIPADPQAGSDYMAGFTLAAEDVAAAAQETGHSRLEFPRQERSHESV